MKKERHGHRSLTYTSPTYRAWHSMRQRCLNPNASYFYLYGGRGIKICPQWSSFSQFLADMGEVPEGLTLERKESNGDYTPENCKWATPKQQANNRRNNHFLTVNGLTLTATQWAERQGIRPVTVHSRLQWGWTPEAAVLTPVLSRSEIGRIARAAPGSGKQSQTQIRRQANVSK